MENHNKEYVSTNLGKKTWTMPELIVIDKKVIEGGYHMCPSEDNSTYCGVS